MDLSSNYFASKDISHVVIEMYVCPCQTTHTSQPKHGLISYELQN